MIDTEFSSESAIDESEDDRQASQNMALNVLYYIGQKYDIATADMERICDLANVRLDALMSHCGGKL